MSKSTRFTIRIATELHAWFKAYAQRLNTSMSVQVTEYIESLRDGKPCVHTQAEHSSEQLITQLTSENTYLRDQVTEKDKQIDHLQQLLAVSQKSILQLTEQNQLLLEDQRRLPLWKRLFRR